MTKSRESMARRRDSSDAVTRASAWFRPQKWKVVGWQCDFYCL
jgi:hypothetical protein